MTMRHDKMSFEEWEELMEEAPGGKIYAPGDFNSLDGVHEIDGEDEYSGLVAHRGVLHPDEYVHHEELISMVESLIGEDFDEIRRVYGPGGLSAADYEFRRRVDSKFLDISESGGDMKLLGSILGFRITPDRHCRAMERAIRRAREERDAPSQ